MYINMLIKGGKLLPSQKSVHCQNITPPLVLTTGNIHLVLTTGNIHLVLTTTLFLQQVYTNIQLVLTPPCSYNR